MRESAYDVEIFGTVKCGQKIISQISSDTTQIKNLETKSETHHVDQTVSNGGGPLG